MNSQGGKAKVIDGRAEVQLEVEFNQAGTRIVEVALEAPNGDTIAGNNRRYLAFDVARDRIRLLHVAGRPTYDVRALRTWLKSDESVDVVAFFILRTDTDVTGDSPRRRTVADSVSGRGTVYRTSAEL